MQTKQRGITLIGWLVLLAPFAVVLYTGIRLTPIYLNYMKVAHSLEAIKSEYSANDANAASLNTSLQKQFDVQSVDYPTPKDIKITRDGKSWVMEASYDDQAPLFANISIQVAFHKVVQIGSSGNN
jgi:Domain of unknown function (DUF4845)